MSVTLCLDSLFIFRYFTVIVYSEEDLFLPFGGEGLLRVYHGKCYSEVCLFTLRGAYCILMLFFSHGN